MESGEAFSMNCCKCVQGDARVPQKEALHAHYRSETAGTKQGKNILVRRCEKMHHRKFSILVKVQVQVPHHNAEKIGVRIQWRLLNALALPKTEPIVAFAQAETHSHCDLAVLDSPVAGMTKVGAGMT
jgi:hypothetical protein